MRRHASLSRTAIAIVLVAAALLLLALGQQGQLGQLQNLLSTVLTPLQEGLAELAPVIPADEQVAPQALLDRNATLAAENARLRSEAVRLREAVAERDMLAELLDFERENYGHTYLTAEVIGRDPSAFLQFLILNKGTTSGVQRGMPVVTGAGLAGVISEATPRASKVLMVNSAQMAVNVRLQESRATGVLFGQASSDLRLRFVPLDADLSAGNLAVTSGLGGTLPADIPVGEVASVRRRAYDVFQEAEVLPMVDFSRLELVLIITDFTPTDLNPLLATAEPGTP
ncbi:MAG: rod shape-determining protein MreC [Anaerolineales bacterium]|jgi:rod shape-determining protein MreC|nr:rod shape-determining protein MreC [Anaerolineales bacterium]|tara:strand:+ start:3889 stop:4743 length:855 start_codon:yes stop_codon:yes gene_type:complete